MHGRAAVVAVLLSIAGSMSAQSSHEGFVARLGRDTMHAEQFTRDGSRITGTIVTRSPRFRLTRWAMTLDGDGRPMRYEATNTDASGAAVLDGLSGTMTFERDSITREGYVKGVLTTTRVAAPSGAYPSPAIPYTGVSYLMYERALADARHRGDSSVYWLTLIPAQKAPQRVPASFVGSDSAELSYFGVAKTGYRFAADGRLLRADWSLATYAYDVQRVSDIDVEALAKRWADAERRGGGVGEMSPRDSVKATRENAALTLDYSRPAVRGREIWGKLVPWDTVWRLGADVATHFTTSRDLEIGGTLVPAGRYTLWMIPSRTAPMLVVSRAVNVFGTGYNPARDLARIPIQRRDLASPVERLTLAFDDDRLNVRWANIEWFVPIVVK